MPQQFTSPTGRIVQGDPWEGNVKNQDGTPRVVKAGPNIGKPSPQWFIAVAFAKTDPAWPAFHQIFKNEAATAWPTIFPQGPNGPPAMAFSMKIVDGDDQTGTLDPTTGRINRPCDKEGFPGHWVVKFSSGFAPKVYEEVPAGSGSFLEVTDKNRLKRGYYVRVAGGTQSNDNPQKPGLYVNLNMIQIVAQGVEIVSGPDAASAFGGAGPAALPVGATPLQPAVGGFTPPAPAAALAPTPAPAYPVAPVATPAPPSNPAAPYAGYMQAPPAAPAAPAPAPAPTGPMLTPAGQAAFPGGSYEGFLAAGWTDAALRQAGYVA